MMLSLQIHHLKIQYLEHLSLILLAYLSKMMIQQQEKTLLLITMETIRWKSPSLTRTVYLNLFNMLKTGQHQDRLNCKEIVTDTTLLYSKNKISLKTIM